MSRAGKIRMAAAAALLGAALTGGLAAQTPLPQGSRAKAILDESATEDTKKQLIGLDWSVMKAAQQRDRATLETLLAPDFTITRLVDSRELIVGSRDAFLELNQSPAEKTPE